jgi:hypothetical protein
MPQFVKMLASINEKPYMFATIGEKILDGLLHLSPHGCGQL